MFVVLWSRVFIKSYSKNMVFGLGFINLLTLCFFDLESFKILIIRTLFLV